MLPALPLLSILIADVVIFFCAGYYLLRLRAREKKVEKKENSIDSSYHHVVDEALSKERKIVDDATAEADQIITGAQYITHASKEEVAHAIQDLVTDIKKEGNAIAGTFTTEYTTSLKHLTTESLSEFKTIMTGLQEDLKKQIQEFHESLLPEVEKEIEAYKKARLQQIDQTTTDIVQKAAQEIFNKSLSLSDHESIVIASLEKAKNEGIFD